MGEHWSRGRAGLGGSALDPAGRGDGLLTRGSACSCRGVSVTGQGQAAALIGHHRAHGEADARVRTTQKQQAVIVSVSLNKQASRPVMMSAAGRFRTGRARSGDDQARPPEEELLVSPTEDFAGRRPGSFFGRAARGDRDVGHSVTPTHQRSLLFVRGRLYWTPAAIARRASARFCRHSSDRALPPLPAGGVRPRRFSGHVAGQAVHSWTDGITRS